jgi:CRISPR-associated protein Csm4
MDFIISRMHFTTAVHFGKDSLTDSNLGFHADSLFSAICLEILKLYDQSKLDAFVATVKNGDILFSDCFPFLDSEYYLPKPLWVPVRDEKLEYSRKKAFKQLKYISPAQLSAYLHGSFDPLGELEVTRGFGSAAAGVRVQIGGDPYYIGSYSFSENAGLYFIFGTTSKEDQEFLKTIIGSLSFTGIGGKRSSGLGRFEVSFVHDNPLLDQLKDTRESKTNLLLSTSMLAKDDSKQTLQDASFLLERRGGFIFSNSYSDTPRRKKDLYCFVSGSCFHTRFEGDVFDVSTGGAHPVYHYAKPLFLGVHDE